MENNFTPIGFASLIEKIRKWSAPFLGVAAFIFGLGKVVSERQVGDGIDHQPKTEKIPQYPKWRKWSLMGMILLPALTFSGFAVADYIERRLPGRTIILIANFDGPNQKIAVTQTVINRMKRATGQFPEVDVKSLGDVIKEGADIKEVSKIGAKHKASIVVWGRYDEALNGTVHIDQVRRTSSFSIRRNEMNFDVRLSEGRGIAVQEALSGDMSLLTLLIIGAARYDAGDYDGAIERFTKALDKQYSLKSENEADDVKFFLGKSLYGKRRYREAINKLQEVVSHRGDNTDVLDWLGSALEWAGQYAEAEPLFKRALVIREKALGPEHPDIAMSLNKLASVYQDQGKYVEAELFFKRALAIREKVLGPERPDTAMSLNGLAAVYYDQGKYVEAEPLFERALAICEKALGPEHPETAANLNGLAVVYRDQGKYVEAEPLFKRALAIREKALGPEHPDTADSLHGLARLYRDQGKYVEAEPLFERALAIREKALGPEHPDTAACLENYAGLMRKLNRENEATKLEARAKKIREKANQK